MAEETKKRKYSAADMRKYAARFDDRNDPMAVCFCDKEGWHPNHAEIDVQRMLIQGAEMIERCEELMKQCVVICGKPECDHKGDKCIQCARPVINFIVIALIC